MKEYSHLSEIRVFSHDRKSVFLGIAPNNSVGCSFQADILNMHGIRIEIG